MNLMVFFPGYDAPEGRVPPSYVEAENEADYQAALAAGGQPVADEDAASERHATHGLDLL